MINFSLFVRRILIASVLFLTIVSVSNAESVYFSPAVDITVKGFANDTNIQTSLFKMVTPEMWGICANLGYFAANQFKDNGYKGLDQNAQIIYAFMIFTLEAIKQHYHTLGYTEQDMGKHYYNGLDVVMDPVRRQTAVNDCGVLYSKAVDAGFNSDANVTAPDVNRAKLFVKSIPESARVRVLNIVPIYSEGIALEPGKYHIEVSAEGYDTYIEWHTLEVGDNSIEVILEKRTEGEDDAKEQEAAKSTTATQTMEHSIYSDFANEYGKENAETLCKESFTKRGVLEKGKYDYCVNAQREGFMDVKYYIEEYQEKIAGFDVLFNKAVGMWTKRGIRNDEMLAYELKLQIDSWLDIEYEKSQSDFTTNLEAQQKLKKCEDEYEKNYELVWYCYEKL